MDLLSFCQDRIGNWRGGTGARALDAAPRKRLKLLQVAHELGVGTTRLQQAYFQLKGLILAQNERWRRGLGMQVVREGASHFRLSDRLSWQMPVEATDSLGVRGSGKRRKGE